MSKLIYVSDYPDRQPDQVLATFVGTPTATLGEAISYFNVKTFERAQRFVSGAIPDVPDVILKAAQHTIDTCPTAAHVGGSFTITQQPDGFTIWQSDGPEQFRLID